MPGNHVAACVVGALVLALAVSAAAQELVYRPINPSFGGDPFNSSHLIATARDQNSFRAPREDRNPLANIDSLVQRSLLSRIVSQVNQQIFGEDALDSGTFIIENTTIQFERINDHIHIQISDAVTGSQTVIQVPTGL